MEHLAQVKGAPPVTLDGLLAHVRKYGLDIVVKATPRYTPRHNSWKALSKESSVEVAIEALGVESFVLFIEGVGYRHFRDQAREAWAAARGLETADGD